MVSLDTNEEDHPLHRILQLDNPLVVFPLPLYQDMSQGITLVHHTGQVINTIIQYLGLRKR